MNLRLATGEEARLAQEHRKPARRESQAVCGTREEGCELRIEPLRDAVTNGALHRGREACGAARVRDLDGVVEDLYARRDSGEREVSVCERVSERLSQSGALVVRARRDGRLRLSFALNVARTPVEQVAVTLDESQCRLEEIGRAHV